VLVADHAAQVASRVQVDAGDHGVPTGARGRRRAGARARLPRSRWCRPARACEVAGELALASSSPGRRRCSQRPPLGRSAPTPHRASGRPCSAVQQLTDRSAVLTSWGSYA
jgi:hypothetical protein